MTNRIKQLRKENGLTLKELSREVGIPASTISQYENERRKIPASALKTLSTFFEVPENYILGAWSEKEVIELMSSSLLDNYEKIFEMTSRYAKGYEWMLFEFIDLKNKHELGEYNYEEREVTAENEILSNNYMSLAFSIMRFVYFEGGYDDTLYELERKKHEDAKEVFFRIRRMDLGYKQVKNLVSNLHKKSSSKAKKEYLNNYFRKDIYLKSVLSSLVVQKLMAEKVTAETMALSLVTAVNYESMRIRADHNAAEIMKADDQTNKMLQQIDTLSKRIDELLKENDRLKAELASKR